MSKIKILTDSPSDLTSEQLTKYDISLVPITVIVDGESFRDKEEISQKEVYEIVRNTPDKISTAAPSPDDFLKAYKEAKDNGYDTVIASVINSKASATYQNALIAREFFAEAGNSLRIEIIDSGTYSMLVGNGILKMRECLENGKSVEEAIDTAKKYYEKATAYACLGTLEHLKRTGRISKLQGIIGGVLDIKPVIRVADAAVVQHDKIRGQKNIIPKLVELVEKEIADNCDELLILYGDETPESDELIAALTEKFGINKFICVQVGCALCINTGPKLIGVAFIRK